jgi:bacteriocin-like protein
MKNLELLNENELISISGGENGWYYLGAFFTHMANAYRATIYSTRCGGRC